MTLLNVLLSAMMAEDWKRMPCKNGSLFMDYKGANTDAGRYRAGLREFLKRK